MKNNKLIIPNIVVSIVIVLLSLILPVEIKNTASFFYTMICFILFNLVGCFMNVKITENNLRKDINNIPIIYIYVVFDIILAIYLIISKCINVTINISVILTLIMFTIYFVIVYSLIHAKKYINGNSEKVYEKIYDAKKWLTSIEILVKNEGKYNKELSNLYEMLKYMDLTSNESTYEIDNEINTLINKIEKKVDLETITSIEKLVNKRKIVLKNERR